jgi:hypothetical protein
MCVSSCRKIHPDKFMGVKIFPEGELSTLIESSLDINIEKEYDALTKQLNAINRKMFDVYRLSTFHVQANNSHKHPARKLITATSVERAETPPSVRILMGELEKQETRKAARLSTRRSKDDQPEDLTQATSEIPSKIETIPQKSTRSAHGLWKQLQSGNTRTRKTKRKTTAINPLS